MKNLFVGLIVLVTTVVFAGEMGSKLSLPKSVQINASSTSVVPISFSTSVVGTSSQSLALQGLDSNFHHLQIINQTSTSISWVTANDVSAPASNSSNKQYVIANGIATWDDVLLLNNIFIQSEGAQISSSYIQIQVW